MRLLVLGGTHFVGRAIVEAAVAAGVDVTMLNRGRTTVPGPQVRTLVADRTDRDALGAALGDETWDVIIDTWSDAPRVVADACELPSARTRTSAGCRGGCAGSSAAARYWRRGIRQPRSSTST